MKNQSKLLNYLIQQCKKPTGIIGNIMIIIWNQTFINLASWGLSHIEINPKEKILEIGCGGGKFIHYLGEKQRIQTIYGIDASEIAIKKAKKLSQGLIATKQVTLLQGTAETLPFQKAMFHQVFAIQTHFYWDDLDRAFQNIYSLLKNQGNCHLICEKEKIRYHLPQYLETNCMCDFLKKHGFSNIQVFETTKWIHFECSKKETC